MPANPGFPDKALVRACSSGSSVKRKIPASVVLTGLISRPVGHCQGAERQHQSMYYRRKLILALLEALDRDVSRIAFQKHLFFVGIEQERPLYDFVPYRHGCFSFQAQADKKTLTKHGFIHNRDFWRLSAEENFINRLRQGDKEAILRVVEQVGTLSDQELIRHVCREYPYYAINLENLDDVLSKGEQIRVQTIRPAALFSTGLFTIGYEGLSQERYLNRLIQQDVKVLCDVRRNPFSMKFGFRKHQLQHATEGVGIHYAHIPELGIESGKRRDLDTEEKYRALLREYTGTTLVQSHDALLKIQELIEKYSRVALTCFEADHHHCHRHCVAEALIRRSDSRYSVTHL
ncbi:MAG: DUF488 domain-containing protein [Gammaproteobacteria bacterium]|nr:DUF488 domain-containing protein [Gammaproteobacteria bacterium]